MLSVFALCALVLSSVAQDSDVEALLDSLDPKATPEDIAKCSLLRQIMIQDDGGVAVARAYLSKGKSAPGRLLACVVLRANREVAVLQNFVKDDDVLVRTFACVVAKQYFVPDRDDAPPPDLSFKASDVRALKAVFAPVQMTPDQDRVWIAHLVRRLLGNQETEGYFVDALLESPQSLASVFGDTLSSVSVSEDVRMAYRNALDVILKSEFSEIPSKREQLRENLYSRLKERLDQLAMSSSEERTWALKTQQYLMAPDDLCKALPLFLADGDADVKRAAQRRSFQALEFLARFGRSGEFQAVALQLEATLGAETAEYATWMRRRIADAREILDERERATGHEGEGIRYLCVDGNLTRVTSQEFALCLAKFGTAFITKAQRDIVAELDTDTPTVPPDKAPYEAQLAARTNEEKTKTPHGPSPTGQTSRLAIAILVGSIAALLIAWRLLNKRE